MDAFLEVLKWIGIVLAAGFVGYFGRYLAMMIIEKTRREKAPPMSEPAGEAPVTPEIRLEETSAKVEKKKAKAEAKKAKKAGKQQVK